MLNISATDSEIKCILQISKDIQPDLDNYCMIITEVNQTGFNLGAEYAASIALLAQCNSFLASGWCTGVSEAIRENQGNYRNKYIFDLGFNN